MLSAAFTSLHVIEARAASGGTGGTGAFSNGGTGGASDQAGGQAQGVLLPGTNQGPAGGAAGTSPGGNGANGSGTLNGNSGGGGGGSGTAASPTGGNGGNGGTNDPPFALRSIGGGGGGGGGNGINLSTDVTFSGTATGGNGGSGGQGRGGNGVPSAGNGGNGGEGGAGINVTVDNRTITNSGTIAGGNGGTGGAGSPAIGDSPAGTAGAAGIGGAGISGANLTIVNTGTISGGLGGDGVTRANAITFTGGANTLTVNGGTLTGNISIVGSMTLGTSSGLQALNNLIMGSGSVVIGSGQISLTGASTYAGGTTINSNAILTINADDRLGSTDGGLTFSGGTLRLGATFNLSNARTITMGTGGGTIHTDGNNSTISQVVGGTGGLTKTGDGALTLNAFETYSGGTTVNLGTLALGGAGSLLAGSNLTINGGTFDMNSRNQTLGLVSGASGGTLALGTGTLTLGNSGSSTIAGTITGAGGRLVKTGSGALTLSGTNLFGGGVTVEQGTLSLGSNAAAGTGTITTTGSVIDYANGVTISNPILVNSNTTQLQATTGSATQSGVISEEGGARPIEKIGAGTLILSGSNTYSGGTTISAGTLRVTDNANLGANTGAVTINSGTLQFGSGFNAARNIVIGASGGTIDTVTGAGVTIAGVISGTGAVTKLGAGTLTFTSNNTYSGVTTISAGALQLGNGGASGGLAGNIVNNAALIINRTDTINYGGVISGTGSVTKLGANTVNLTGTSTYTGATLISSGVFGVNGSISSSAVTVANGGTLGGTGTVGTTTVASGGTLAPGNSIGTINVSGNIVFNAGATYAVELSPTGSDRTNVTGTANLAGNLSFVVGAGTYVAGTQYTLLNAVGGVSGTFTVGDLTSLFGSTIRPIVTYDLNNVFLRLDASITDIITASNRLSDIGVRINQNFAGGTLVLASGESSNLPFTVSALNGTLSIASGSATMSGIFSGVGSMTKTGAGMVVLNGVNTYTGTTTVSAGELRIGDAGNPGARLAGNVSVNAGATLSGFGTIGGTVTNNGGTVHPGGSIGTLTVANFSQDASGNFAVEVSPSAASLLIVAGTANIAGTVTVAFEPGVYTGRAYPLIRAGQVNGTFSTVNFLNAPANAAYGLYYDPNRREFALITQPQSASEIFGDLATVSLDHAQMASNLLLNRVGNTSCDAEDSWAVAQTKGATSCEKMTAWVRPYASYLSTDAGGISGQTINHGSGILGGLDWRFESGAVLGVGGSYIQDRFAVNNASTRARRNGYTLAVYGTLPMGDAWFDAEAYYADGKWETSRPGISGEPNARVQGAAAQVRLPMYKGDVVPFARLNVASVKMAANTETGVGGFSYRESAVDSAKGTVGVRFKHTYTLESGMTITPEARGGIEHEFQPTDRKIFAQLPLQGATPFVAQTASPDATAAVLGAGLTIKQSEAVQVFADVDGRFSGNQTGLAASVGLRIRF